MYRALMANLPPDVVQLARDEADEWEGFKDGATFAMGGVAPVVAVATDPVVGAICGAAAAAMVMLGSKKARAAKRKADDPPDKGYARATLARRAPFHPEAFGESLMGKTAVGAIEALRASIAFDLAMVRAEERSQGAREAGDLEAEKQRSSEALTFAYRSAESSTWVASTTERLASQLEEIPYGRAPFDPGTVPRRLDEALPDQTLVILFRAGFRIDDLRTTIRRRPDPPADPLGFIAGELRRAGLSTREFGHALLGVAPTVFGSS